VLPVLVAGGACGGKRDRATVLDKDLEAALAVQYVSGASTQI
jgi:hypothetical protein